LASLTFYLTHAWHTEKRYASSLTVTFLGHFLRNQKVMRAILRNQKMMRANLAHKRLILSENPQLGLLRLS